MEKAVIVKFYEQANLVIADIAARSSTSKLDASLLRAIDAKVELLKTNPFIGEKIRKGLIPKEYRRLGISSLYRLELPQFWRMLYTVRGNSIEIIAVIIDIVDHKKYNKKFKYKR